MKNSTHNPRFSVFSIVCNTFGHNYRETRKITNHISEFKCSHCGCEVTNNFSGSFEPLTEKYKQANASLNLFYKRKMRRVTTTA
ncbi:hypothetical protein [Cochleicola gelatinilyticus]|uniref:hypothetical protein n=1 Tax=Cochleicola gelatinilyticus TaxID=1763537 RepID=UPI0012F8B210|nr:hypothetical protein [Cochleicola gelatinilyticus]